MLGFVVRAAEMVASSMLARGSEQRMHNQYASGRLKCKMPAGLKTKGYRHDVALTACFHLRPLFKNLIPTYFTLGGRQNENAKSSLLSGIPYHLVPFAFCLNECHWKAQGQSTHEVTT